MVVACTDEGLHLTPDPLVSLGSHGGEMVSAAVYVGVAAAVVGIEGLDYRQGLLGRGRIVEIDKRVAVHRDIKYGELFSYIL